MDDWKLPSYGRALENGSANASYDETMLEHDLDDSDDDDEENDAEAEARLGGRKSIKSTLWMILMTTATLAARRILNGGFPYPFYYLLLLHLPAYVCVAFIVLLAKLNNLRSPRRKTPEDEKYTGVELFTIGIRIVLSSSIGALSILCGAQALLLFPNLPLLAMLPILTYVFDSLLFRFADTIHLLPRDQSISWERFYRPVLIPICAFIALYDDYRLNMKGLLVLLTGFLLSSLSKVVSKIRPQIKSKGPRSWESPLQIYLVAGIAPMVITGIATATYENVTAASAISRNWTMLYWIISLGPGIALHIIYGSSLLSAYPFISQEHVAGALEEDSNKASDAVTSTLQAGFWILVIGVLGNERNFVTWTQVIAFTSIYIISVGPKHIGYYPPRLMNLILRLFQRRPLAIRAEPWQFSLVLVSTTLIFAILVSTNTTFWVDTIAYNHDLKTWLGPKNLTLDTLYRPPEMRSFDIVIAHSEGDSTDSIRTLVDHYARHYSIAHLAPKVKVYTKDPKYNLPENSANSLKGEFEGSVTIQLLPNTGGISGTYLHHILLNWDSLPVQTLFLSTRGMTDDSFQLHYHRFEKYFTAAGFPIPDAVPKTGFLNLGPQEACWCGGCTDRFGWEDTFNLIPSMWNAARPKDTKCESVLITHGNNFLASAARIRGTSHNAWQTLYDGLYNSDVINAWAHAPEKMPKKLPGEENMGRWAEGGIYSEGDSVEKPYLDLTVERLWGILLQCSTGEIAWKCPSLEREKRTGGDKEDCGCIE